MLVACTLIVFQEPVFRKLRSGIGLNHTEGDLRRLFCWMVYSVRFHTEFYNRICGFLSSIRLPETLLLANSYMTSPLEDRAEGGCMVGGEGGGAEVRSGIITVLIPALFWTVKSI